MSEMQIHPNWLRTAEELAAIEKAREEEHQEAIRRAREDKPPATGAGTADWWTPERRAEMAARTRERNAAKQKEASG